MYGMRFLTRGVQRVLSHRPLLAARKDMTYVQPSIFRYKHSKEMDDQKVKEKMKLKQMDTKEEEKTKDKKDDGKSKGSKGSYDNSDGSGANLGYSPIAMKIVPAVCGASLNYAERNIKLGRHLSPCLSIYKRQLTSVMSISLRVTGFFLAFCVWSVGLLGFFSSRDLGQWADKLAECDLKRSIVNAAKFVLVFPFAYHLVAGTRHILWMFNIFLTKPEIYATGYIAIALSALITAALLCLEWGDDAKAAEVDITDTEETANRQILQEQQDDLEDQFDEGDEELESKMATKGPEEVSYKRNKEEIHGIDLKLKSKD